VPFAFTHITVPKFSANQIALAEVCAIELWNGYNYQTGKKSDVSDEDLMVMFSTPTFAMFHSPHSLSNITELDIRELIRLANLKALFRSSQPTDFQGAIAAYRSTALSTYIGWKSKKLTLANPYDYATRATLDWSVKFVNNPKASLNGNHRVPLASRILFFSMPDMMLFNFSNALATNMRLQSRPQAAIPIFNKYLFDGLQLNNNLLKILEFPKPTRLSEDIWTAALHGHWWQRRVLDLALLLHFNIVSAAPNLHSKARLLAAQWAARSKPT